MTMLALFVNLAGVVAVSTFALLFYYALANVSALRLKTDVKLYPKLLPALGLATCIILLAFIQPSALAIGVVCLLIGTLYYVGKEKREAQLNSS